MASQEGCSHASEKSKGLCFRSRHSAALRDACRCSSRKRGGAGCDEGYCRRQRAGRKGASASLPQLSLCATIQISLCPTLSQAIRLRLFAIPILWPLPLRIPPLASWVWHLFQLLIATAGTSRAGQEGDRCGTSSRVGLRRHADLGGVPACHGPCLAVPPTTMSRSRIARRVCAVAGIQGGNPTDRVTSSRRSRNACGT